MGEDLEFKKEIQKRLVDKYGKEVLILNRIKRRGKFKKRGFPSVSITITRKKTGKSFSLYTFIMSNIQTPWGAKPNSVSLMLTPQKELILRPDPEGFKIIHSNPYQWEISGNTLISSLLALVDGSPKDFGKRMPTKTVTVKLNVINVSENQIAVDATPILELIENLTAKKLPEIEEPIVLKPRHSDVLLKKACIYAFSSPSRVELKVRLPPVVMGYKYVLMKPVLTNSGKIKIIFSLRDKKPRKTRKSVSAKITSNGFVSVVKLLKLILELLQLPKDIDRAELIRIIPSPYCTLAQITGNEITIDITDLISSIRELLSKQKRSLS